MDEIGLLRRQVSSERQRLGAVAGALGELLQAGAETVPGAKAALLTYLRQSLQVFTAREERLQSLLARRAPGSPAVNALKDRLGQGPRAVALLQAVERLSSGPAAGAAPQWDSVLATLAQDWQGRGARIEAELAAHARPADWRTVAGVDADSILEERRHFAAVLALVPELAARVSGDR